MTGATVITGGGGFLGWHLRVLMQSLGLPTPILVQRNDFDDPRRLVKLLDGADRLIHLAGVNRCQVTINVDLAARLATAIGECAAPPRSVVFANSIQAGNGSAYGDAKALAADLLRAHGRSSFVDLRLPNLFGEHGKPHYNSVVATFCRVLADGGEPVVHEDRELELLHATQAAEMLLGVAEHRPVTETVVGLADRLRCFAIAYGRGEMPELDDPFAVRLFNTYRSHCRPGLPVRLTRNEDSRGALVEAVRARSGAGQTFFSTTAVGVTRGDHFHLSKVERFVVVRGEAEIRLRQVGYEEVVRIRVSGSDPVAVDMPTMWAHSITNVGADELLTVFWANELFDASHPDTYSERVTA